MGFLNFKKNKMKKNQKFGFIAILVLLASFASSASATYSLPADRSVTWQGNVGVSGDIPNRTTVCKTLSPSGGDDAAAIQSAITACPAEQVVKLNAGTFIVKSQIKLKSKITLKGEGMGKTIIKGAAGMTGKSVLTIGTGWSFGTPFNIKSGLSKGSVVITVAAPHNWVVGDVIVVDQLNNPLGDPPVTNVGNGPSVPNWTGRSGGTRSLGQMIKVTKVPTTTSAELEIPLYWNYNSSLSPQATKISGLIQKAGVEDLTVDNNDSANIGQTDASGGTITINAAENSWLYRVEGIKSWESLLRIQAAYRNTIRSCKFHEVSSNTYIAETKQRGYGVTWYYFASGNLFENNQLYHFGGNFFTSGQFSGNVVAYNSIKNSVIDPTSANFTRQMLLNHGAHAMMNLYESNDMDARIASDFYWGTSSHNTFFRNRVKNVAGKTGGVWLVDLIKNSYYFNFVGNVLGVVGVETAYEQDGVTLTGKKSVYRFGYEQDGDGSPTGNDSKVRQVTLRHANWSSITDPVGPLKGAAGIMWNGSDDRTLPTSFYLTAKPTWWGNGAWPAIGPDLNPMTNDIPAISLNTTPITPTTPTIPTTPTPVGCNTLTFVSGFTNPVSVDANVTYNMSCDYGLGNINSIKANNDLGSCSFAGFVGTAATFTCNAGIAGTRVNTCSLISGTTANTCAQTNQINTVAVGSAPVAVTYSLVNFTNLNSDWLKTVTSPADVNQDGNVNARDLGIMMSNWK